MTVEAARHVAATVSAAEAGQRLDLWLASQLPALSRTRIKTLIDGGHVQVDGAPRKPSHRLKTGEHVQAVVPAPPADEMAAEAIPLRVILEDAHILVVDKPAGMVTHPGAGRSTGTLAAAALAHAPEISGVGGPRRPGIVHRLDKGTSGLMVVARTERAYASLVAQLAERSAGRVYLALVWGVPESVVGVVDAPIGRSTRDRTRMAVRPEGKAARTRYEVLRTFRRPVPTALVECQLETGRTHQIRVHLAAIGHPVVGDAQYRGDRGAINVARPMLHAARLAITHPTTGERLEFTSALPSDMQSLIDSLE